MSKKLPIVAIVGQTNVGKSSLFNRLYGGQEAIAAREAGTTRDNVVRRITLNGIHKRVTRKEGPARATESDETRARAGQPGATGHVPRPRNFTADDKSSPEDSLADIHRLSSPASSALSENGAAISNDGSGEDNHQEQSFWLIDTAGLKAPEDDFEASIQEQITEASRLADMIVVVVDSTKHPSDEDRRLAKTALKSQKPVLLAINKTDLKSALPSEEFKKLGIREIFRTSAEHNSGLDELAAAIAGYLPARSAAPADDGLKLALIGRPNVGKSYLFNTLAKKQQALTASVAGTTRDVNRTTVRYHGQDIELFDTAGYRKPGKQQRGVEKFSVLRTMAAIDEADVCLLLLDANELNTQLDQKLAGMVQDAGKGLILVVSKWDSVEDKDSFTRDALAPQISYNFKFVPWASLVFTSAVTGQNVVKLFDLGLDVDQRRRQNLKTKDLNDVLQACLKKHPPAGLKNTKPKLRYMVQTDTNPPWFVVFGSNLKLLHWSYKRYLERAMRERFDYAGTAIKFSFRDEKQAKTKPNKPQ